MVTVGKWRRVDRHFRVMIGLLGGDGVLHDMFIHSAPSFPCLDSEEGLAAGMLGALATGMLGALATGMLGALATGMQQEYWVH